MDKYYRIWEETTIPAETDEDTTLITTGPFTSERYADLDAAMKALKYLAASKFNYSKYRLKTLCDIVKVSDREYRTLCWKTDTKLITRRYYIV